MNTVNTTFLILATILVFSMTPGLAFFMGDWFRKKCSQYYVIGVCTLWALCGAIYRGGL